MAKIPAGEQFGQVVAQPARYNETRVPRAAFGTPIGDAMVQTGQIMMFEERQARATAEAAERAKAAQAMREIEADLDVIGDEVSEGIRTGQIDKTQANDEFKARTQERTTAGLESIPKTYQGLAQSSFNTKTTRLSRTVGKAVTQRDQQDVRSGLQSQLEYAQRLYLSDPAAADQIVTESFEALGPFSGLNPADLQKVKQGWVENTRLNKATTLVTAARRDNGLLSEVEKQLESEEFQPLDPQRKAVLLGQIEGYKVSNQQRAEADVRRKQAEEDRRLNIAERQFAAAQSIVTQGKVLSPEYVEQVTLAVSGTPYAAALKETLRQAPERTSFGVQPLAVQQQALIQARAQLNQGGTSPEAEKRITELEKVYSAAVKDYAEEPLQAALERGVITQIAPINTQSMEGLVQTIAPRIEQASIARQQTGSPVSPLLKSEAEAAGRMINILPVEQRASALAQLAQVLGPEQASALGRQMAPKDKALGIALGMSGVKTSAGRYTSELVLRGAQAMRDKAVAVDNKALTGVRARVVEEIGDAYQNQELRETMIDAAVYAEYGLQSEGSGSVRRAVGLVTGGITEHNGKKIPMPYGMKADQFEQRIKTLTPADIKTENVFIGGAQVPSAQFLQSLPNATLIHAGQGRYAVQAGSGLVLTYNRTPLILEIR